VRRYNGSNNNGNNQPNDGEAWRVNGNGNGNGNSSGTMTTADSDSTMEEQSTAQHGLKATTATTTKRRNGATINQMERHEGGAPWRRSSMVNGNGNGPWSKDAELRFRMEAI
jgi:hypothetical protein